MRTALALLALLIAPTIAHAEEIAFGQSLLDLRALRPDARPVAATMTFHVPAEAAARHIVLSLAINGAVFARRTVTNSGPITVTAVLPDRLIAIRNIIEAAATISACETPCAALNTIKVVGPVRFRLAPATLDSAEFPQLPARMRAGVTIETQDAEDDRFAAQAKHALAPLAPSKPSGGSGARIIVAAAPPAGFQPAVRFDAGSVALKRRGGGTIIPAAVLRDATVVQILRGGKQPVVWVRPGVVMPPQLDLQRGNVAVFGPAGPLVAFSTAIDARTIRIVYASGFDPSQRQWWIAVRRWTLLVLWLLATGVLFLIARRSRGDRRLETSA